MDLKKAESHRSRSKVNVFIPQMTLHTAGEYACFYRSGELQSEPSDPLDLVVTGECLGFYRESHVGMNHGECLCSQSPTALTLLILAGSQGMCPIAATSYKGKQQGSALCPGIKCVLGQDL